MNTFYESVSKRHLEKLIEERDYYLSQAENLLEDGGYKLMADFYDALIVAAQKHIAEHSQKA